jgi:hypothetical protein
LWQRWQPSTLDNDHDDDHDDAVERAADWSD